MTPLLKILGTIGLLLAIPTECVLLYTQIQDARSQMSIAINARDRQLSEAELAAANAKTLLQTAQNAAVLKKAEADKFFADARAAEEVADNARGRQASEAQIAVEKAKQELANAQNAERRASAEADKMEAEAVTAKQFGETSIQRSRAEAAQARADLMSLQSKLRSVWKYPYNCTRYKTFPDCVDGLRKAVADGRWSRP
jgi:SOS response regulatory protein OraA/RecX